MMLESEPSETRSESWYKGILRAGPIVLGYVPVAFAYGVLAQKAGLGFFNTMMMSLLVYAGASQLIAVGLVQAGASPGSVIVATLVVNLRHLILSSAIAPRLRNWSRGRLAAFGFELTDETFALHTTTLLRDDPGPSSMFATNLTAQASWLLGSALGAAVGWAIPDVRPLALDFALPALFTALLALQLRTPAQALTALFSGLLAVGLVLAGWDVWSIVAATLAGATLGTAVETWIRKRSSS